MRQGVSREATRRGQYVGTINRRETEASMRKASASPGIRALVTSERSRAAIHSLLGIGV